MSHTGQCHVWDIQFLWIFPAKYKNLKGQLQVLYIDTNTILTIENGINHFIEHLGSFTMKICVSRMGQSCL